MSAPTRLSTDGDTAGEPDLGEDHCFFIGIDFGTTFSGVAYAYSGDPDNVTIVRGWQSQDQSHVIDDAKVPTRIAYVPYAAPEWGHNIQPGRNAISWFKLLLVKDFHLPPNVANTERLTDARMRLRDANKTPEDATADYLGLLWRHTLVEMERELGRDAMDLPFRVVITVPAIWKPYAVKKMREAAERAGILADRPGNKATTLRVVSEPEAAAMASLWSARNKHTFKNNDIYTICDIGGGTTDIISYRVKSAKPLILTECVEGAGDMCGAIFTDEAFSMYLRSKFGAKWSRLSDKTKVRLMNDDWEHGIKRRFNSNPSAAWTITVPSETVKLFNPKVFRRSGSSGVIELTTGELTGVFGHTLDRTRQLINQQIYETSNSKDEYTAKPRAIILVGGFGACRYIADSLKNEHRASGIEVIQPRGDEPWTAICRGAVLKARFAGDQNIVHSRRSRLHFGLIVHTYYREAFAHLKHRMYVDEWGDRKVNIATWYISKGDVLETLSPLKKDYQRRFDINSTGPVKFRVHIYCSDSPLAPQDPLDPSVAQVYSFPYTLPVQFEDLPIGTSKNGKQFRQVDYEVGMDTEDAEVQFSLWYNGEQQRPHAIDATFESAPSPAAIPELSGSTPAFAIRTTGGALH